MQQLGQMTGGVTKTCLCWLLLRFEVEYKADGGEIKICGARDMLLIQ